MRALGIKTKMVQLKYYGDDRDYFKYDLISFILKSGIFKQYGFVPMLTKHRYDNEGNIPPTPSDCKSKKLLNFISLHPKPDLNNWELWLKKYVYTYNCIQPINTNYFNDDNRIKYWEAHEEIISANNSLIFFDPDTGIQAGRASRIKTEEKEKYILNNEICTILDKLSHSSMFVIYQHLQWNSKKHEQDIKNKCNALSNIYKTINITMYREKDLSFILIAKNETLTKTVTNTLNTYKQKSTVSPRGIYQNA